MFVQVALIILIYMSLVFILAHFMKDNSIVDIFWGPGFMVVALYSLMISPDLDLRKAIVAFLVTLWSIRLSIHILLRNRGKGEDFRYKNWRDTWKNFILRSYLQIFLLQGFFMLVISAPVWFINASDTYPLGIFDSIGLLLFGIGFIFEAVGDLQLTLFRKDPANKGRIITSGLWQYTRHPNYFGEALLWWGIWFYALALPYGWITVIGPITITLLLRYVSGVPMLEKKYEGRADWEEYKQRTAPFIPFVKFL